MAQRHGEGVGGVVRARDALQVQQVRRDQLDLLFFRLAVAGKRLLDLHGRVFEQPAAALDAGEKRHAARVGDGDARGHVFGKEQLFHRHFVRPAFVEQAADALFEDGKAGGQALVFGRADDAVIEGAHFAARVFFQYPVAEGGKAGVDA